MVKNFITLAKNFEGTHGFQNFYNSEGKDILNEGELSCAVFVSTILAICREIQKISFTVAGLCYQLENKKNFLRFDEPSLNNIITGDIVVWDSIHENGSFHIGFALDSQFAISNRSSQGAPGRHELIYTGLHDEVPVKVKILKIYRLKAGK